MPTVACPHCNTPLTIRDGAHGAFRCPRCKKQLHIPQPIAPPAAQSSPAKANAKPTARHTGRRRLLIAGLAGGGFLLLFCLCGACVAPGLTSRAVLTFSKPAWRGAPVAFYSDTAWDPDKYKGKLVELTGAPVEVCHDTHGRSYLLLVEAIGVGNRPHFGEVSFEEYENDLQAAALGAKEPAVVGYMDGAEAYRARWAGSTATVRGWCKGEGKGGVIVLEDCIITGR